MRGRKYMIKVKLTQNYTGFNIEGTFDDLYELYDNIDYFLGLEECEDIFEEDMRLHILGFLYDLRHAYQGARNIKAVDNVLNDEQKEYYGIAKSVKKDILYDFNYVVPELLTDILIFKHFAKGTNNKLSEYDTNYNGVMTFYSKVIDALKEILTEKQVKKVKKLFSESSISERYWLRQWFMMVCIDYLKMTKNKRQKEMMHIITSICESYLYNEYNEIKNEVKEYAKENNIIETEVEYGEYPEEVEW